MTSREGTLALAIVGCLLLALTGCTQPSQPAQQVSGQGEHAAGPPPNTGGGPVGVAANQTIIKISYDQASGNCTQYDANDTVMNQVGVPNGNIIRWEIKDAAGLGIHVEFAPTAPFWDFNSKTIFVVSGPTSAPPETGYIYNNVTIGANKCKNPYQLGIIMR